MSRQFLTGLTLCLGMSMLASCSLFQSAPDKEKEPEKETKAKTPAITEIAPLPGGDPLINVSTPVNPMLPMTRPFLREPDVTTSLPLNLDGSTVRASEAKDELIPAPAPEEPDMISPLSPAPATAPLMPAPATTKAPATPAE